MYCPNCGKQLPEGAKFCGACGSMLAEPVNMKASGSASAEELIVSGYEEGLYTAERTAALDFAEELFKANVTAVPEHAGEPVPIEEARAPELDDLPAGSALNSMDPDVPKSQTGQSAAGRSHKNNVLPVLLIAGIVIIIIAGNVIIAMIPTDEERWQEQYDLGQQYLLELNYEQAIVAFTAAIEIDENDSSAWAGRAQSYYGLGVQEMETTARKEEGDGLSETAQEYMSSALNDYDMALTLGDTQPNIYIGMGEVYVALGNYEEAVSILEMGTRENPEDTAISEKLSEVTTAIQIQTLQQEHWDAVIALINAVMEDPLNIGVDDWYGDAFDSFLSGLDSEIFCELESGWYLGIYPTGYIYYGEMEKGQRSGEGYWIYAGGALYKNVVYYGEWTEDYPNGWGQYCNFYLNIEGELAETILIEINFTNGHPNGTGTFTCYNTHISGSCKVQAVEGNFIGIYTDVWEDGDSYIALIEDSNGGVRVGWPTNMQRDYSVAGACISSDVEELENTELE